MNAQPNKKAIRARLQHIDQPDWPTTKEVARDEHLAENAVWNWIGAGDLNAGVTSRKLPTIRRKTPILVTRHQVVVDPLGIAKCVKEYVPMSTPKSDDGEPLQRLLNELLKDETKKVALCTVLGWLDWDPHPALGVKQGKAISHWSDRAEYSFGRSSGAGHTRCVPSQIVSRADLAACISAYLHPEHHRFPGVPGFFLSEGVFQHDDGRHFFTRVHIAKKRMLGDNVKYGDGVCGLLDSPSNRRILDTLDVVWPKGTGYRGRWSKEVFSQDSLLLIAKRRTGKQDGGSWLDHPRLWLEDGVVWYSSAYIAQLLGVISSVIARLRDDFLTQFKIVPQASADGRRGKAKPLWVHHEKQVRHLLGMDEPDAVTTNETATVMNQAERVSYPDLGIEVDHEARTIFGTGRPIPLAGAQVQWHIFRVVLAAHPRSATKEQIWRGYPGNKNDDTLDVHTNVLNKKLVRLGVRVSKRQIAKIGKNEA